MVPTIENHLMLRKCHVLVHFDVQWNRSFSHASPAPLVRQAFWSTPKPQLSTWGVTPAHVGPELFEPITILAPEVLEPQAGVFVYGLF